MIRYIIEFALIHSLLLLVYKMVMGKETQLGFLRGYLQLSMIIAIIVPFIHLPALGPVPAVDISGTVTMLLLPEIVVTSAGPVSGGIHYTDWLIWIFATGALITTIRLLIGLLKIRLIFRGSKPVELLGKRVYHKDYLKSSFAYFNKIIIDKEHFKNPLEIVHHEEAHVKYGHSYDLLAANLLTIPFWWLPSMWIMIREFKKIHEYQADAYALKASTLENYINVLVNNVLVNHGLELTSSFHDTKIFERLKFINKMKKSISPLKIYSTILLVALTAFVFSCEDKLGNETTIAVERDQAMYPDIIQNKLSELQTANPESEYAVIQVPDGDELPNISMQALKFFSILNIDEHKVTFMIVEKGSLVTYGKSEEIPDNEEVFKVVEEVPTFPGGLQTAFFKYVSENIKYPKEAVEQGVTGKVFVQFIVDKNGEIRDAQVLRGIGYGCDEEAIRVIKNSPDWIPGKQRGENVNVRMVLPITFQL
jgi:TonB family protein